jgi:hypothetical protein
VRGLVRYGRGEQQAEQQISMYLEQQF